MGWFGHNMRRWLCGYKHVKWSQRYVRYNFLNICPLATEDISIHSPVISQISLSFCFIISNSLFKLLISSSIFFISDLNELDSRNKAMSFSVSALLAKSSAFFSHPLFRLVQSWRFLHCHSFGLSFLFFFLPPESFPSLSFHHHEIKYISNEPVCISNTAL